jgi:hypothetical protein
VQKLLQKGWIETTKSGPTEVVLKCCKMHIEIRSHVRVPTKPAMHSNSKPAGYSNRKPATLGVNRMGRFDDVVEG